MCPLETAEQNIRRLTFDPEIVLPCPEADKNVDIQLKMVSCENCGTKYCSSSCYQEASAKYHGLMCNFLQPNQPFDIINEIWK
jgi:hypothetical protein